MSMTTQAVVDVRALQKSLNQMSRDERVEFIRASGDPKISVRIAARDADQPNAPAQPSPVAENLLKERIKAFGFRTWSDDEAAPPKRSRRRTSRCRAKSQVKKLSARLEASGVTVTKYTLASWTVKCIDRATGEEIYFNTALPKGIGSWAGEGDAMKAIGAKIADEFSRNFFLQHVAFAGQKVVLRLGGLDDARATALFARELIGLTPVLSATQRPGAAPPVFDLVLAGNGPPQDLVVDGILRAINAKLGEACFNLGASAGNEVSVSFAPKCAEAAMLNRLETAPPAGLYSAPPGRAKSVVKNPETLQKITTI